MHARFNLTIMAQLCGRAGRGGCQARAHWILNSYEAKIKEPTLKCLVTDTKNCLRTTLIDAVGGGVDQHNSNCCMVCNPVAYTDSEGLGILQVGRAPPRKKRRVAVRKVVERHLRSVYRKRGQGLCLSIQLCFL